MSKKANISHGMDNDRAFKAARDNGCRVRKGKGSEAKVDHPSFPELGLVNVCTHRSRGKGAPRHFTQFLKRVVRRLKEQS
jgi:hypothetical protein